MDMNNDTQMALGGRWGGVNFNACLEDHGLPIDTRVTTTVLRNSTELSRPHEFIPGSCPEPSGRLIDLGMQLQDGDQSAT